MVNHHTRKYSFGYFLIVTRSQFNCGEYNTRHIPYETILNLNFHCFVRAEIELFFSIELWAELSPELWAELSPELWAELSPELWAELSPDLSNGMRIFLFLNAFYLKTYKFWTAFKYVHECSVLFHYRLFSFTYTMYFIYIVDSNLKIFKLT